MKSERRHELQHNELADWLVKSAETIKPYQNLVFAVVVLVLIGAVGYTIWSRVALAQTTQAWDEFNANLETGNVAKLTQVVEDYPNTTVAHMAALVLADNYLGEGCNRLFVNKATAQQELTKAIELYQTVRQESRSPALLERATFGLARAKESKGDAEHIKQAEQLYEDVATQWPNGAYAVAASQRLKDLRRPATKTLYDQFAHFEPMPAFSHGPGGQPSFDLNNMPSEPSSYMPKTTFDLKLGDKDKDKDKGPEKAKEKGKETPRVPVNILKPAADQKAPPEKKAPEKTGK
jgi:hypothetical protein